MTDTLDSELDALFQLLPAEMVEARNALAARLKKSGEREASLRVKNLKRPAAAAWAINQVYFRERVLLEDARAHVASVRALSATDGVDRLQLAAAGSAQRAAFQAIVDAALRYCAAAQLPTGPVQERKVFMTVQGSLAGTGDEAPGRMTRELEPSGFEAIGLLGTPAPLPAAPRPVTPLPAAPRISVTPSAPARAQKSAATSAPKSVPAPVGLRAVPTHVVSPQDLERVARERAGARVLEHKQYVEWAQERVADQHKKQAVAEHEVERAKLELADVERALAQKRLRLTEREDELVRKRGEVEDAEHARRAAEEALAQARAALAKL